MHLTNRDLIDAILVLNEGGGSGGGTGGNGSGKPNDDDQDPAGDDGGDSDDEDDDEDDDEPLGPKGKKALDAEKDRRRAATRELRRFKELGYTPEQITELARKASAKAAKDDSGDDEQRDADELVKQAREDARAEARREALHERVQDKIEAKAAKGFADPEDAVAILLRTNKIEDFLDGDKIDADEIADALDELGKKKPHLLATGKRFQGGGDGGARPSANKRPGSLSEAVTTKMSNR